MEHLATDIKCRQQSKVLEVSFNNGAQFSLPFEYLRVFSPSAEVKGHGPGQEVLQLQKQDVGVTQIEPVGRYAIKIYFDDGHNTGIYSWDYLHELGDKQAANWQSYLQQCKQLGIER